jgi:hypothetical protein
MVSSMEKIMKFRIFVLMLVIVTVTNVFGIDYTNEEYGIHFVLPDHWKVIDYEDFPLEKQQRLDNRYRSFKTLAICGFRGHDGPDLTQIIIQYRRFEGTTFSEAKRFIQTKRCKELMITFAETNAEYAVGKEIKQYSIIESNSDFIKSANRAYGIVHYESNDKPKIVAMEVKFLCKDGWVGLRCFSRGSEANRFVDTVNKIADSFQYDGSSTVVKNEMSEEDASRLSREQTADNIWEWAGIILTILIVLGVIKMLFFR